MPIGDIEATEQQIVDLLRPEFPEYQVDPFPDDLKSYILLHNKGAILVSYRGRTSITDDPMCLREKVAEFAVSINSRNLRQRKAHQGVYNVLERIDDVLYQAGFSHIRDGFQKEDSGVWTYTALFNKTLSYGV